MKKITPFIIATLLVYFCFSFALWKCNPSQWALNVRVAFVVFWISAITLCVPINEIIKLEKQN
jgi:hypothetical protein